MPDTPKAVKIVLNKYGEPLDWGSAQKDQRHGDTPAVAVPVETYNEVRRLLARLANVFPDKMPSTAREALALLPPLDNEGGSND